MRLMQLSFLIGAFWFFGQYSKGFEVPVAAPAPKKPASIKELLSDLTPNKTRGFVLQKGLYTKVELEPGRNSMVFKFILPDNSEKKFLVYNLTSTKEDPSKIVGTFSQGSLLYLTHAQKPNGDRIFSGWIVSPDRTQASPIALLDSASGTYKWPTEFDLNPYLQSIK